MARHRKNGGTNWRVVGWVLLTVAIVFAIAYISTHYHPVEQPVNKALTEPLGDPSPTPHDTLVANRQALVCGAIAGAGFLVWLWLIYRASRKK